VFTQLWARIISSPILKIKLSEFIKLVEITCVQVLGSVEDEWCFLIVAFIKKQAKELLVCHLDLCITVLQM
jgi:hypothetical protein